MDPISFVIGTSLQWQVSLHTNNINLYTIYIFIDQISNKSTHSHPRPASDW
jgi:hypothetical protein